VNVVVVPPLPRGVPEIVPESASSAKPAGVRRFGLPPLEAMANRTPVIASNTSSLPEVLDDAAVLVNPENVFDIARGMKLILYDEILRQKLIHKGIEQVSGRIVSPLKLYILGCAPA
jgi:glycosyltransferase involved in cell wall biosynthesis